MRLHISLYLCAVEMCFLYVRNGIIMQICDCILWLPAIDDVNSFVDMIVIDIVYYFLC